MFRTALGTSARVSPLRVSRQFSSFSLMFPCSASPLVKPMRFPVVPQAQRTFSTSVRARVRNTWQQYNKHYGRLSNRWEKLLKPFLFTVGFCVGTTFIVPQIIDRIPAIRRNPKLIVYGIIALNGAVFLLWRVPQLLRFMGRYMLLVKDNVYLVWSMIGSAFSHQEPLHILINMMVLALFGTTLAQVIGASNFMVMYLNSAVVASFVSLLFPALVGASALGMALLGASGAVFGVVGMFSYLFPKSPVALFFIPIPGGAWFAFLATVGWNIAGLFGKWGRYDYAAHLGGSLVGVGYGWWYKQQLERARAQRAFIF